MYKWLIGTIFVLCAIIGTEYLEIKNLNTKYEIASVNIKAYDNQLSTEGSKNTALQLTIAQLEYFKDSILVELNNTREKLKVKDSNLKSLHQVASSFSKADTIVMKDTIYKDPSLAIDTLIGDAWYSVKVGLRYPSTVTIKPEFKSDKHIIVYTKKETVNPPKKFFLLRWFQKKHLVINVDVVENNPYVTDESSKYIEIIQ